MKPIIFNTMMVRSILKHMKRNTRRPIQYSGGWNPTSYGKDKFYKLVANLNGKLGLWAGFYNDSDVFMIDGNQHIDAIYFKAPYQVGDILYVRETWGNYSYDDAEANAIYFLYRADYPNGAKTYMDDNDNECDLPKWRPSIHMPKKAGRIFFKVTDVRVERIQDIDDEGAMAEGITEEMAYASNDWKPTFYDPDSGGNPDYVEAFKELWNSIYNNWDKNPWVWVIEFERVCYDD